MRALVAVVGVGLCLMMASMQLDGFNATTEDHLPAYDENEHVALSLGVSGRDDNEFTNWDDSLSADAISALNGQDSSPKPARSVKKKNLFALVKQSMDAAEQKAAAATKKRRDAESAAYTKAAIKRDGTLLKKLSKQTAAITKRDTLTSAKTSKQQIVKDRAFKDAVDGIFEQAASTMQTVHNEMHSIDRLDTAKKIAAAKAAAVVRRSTDDALVKAVVAIKDKAAHAMATAHEESEHLQALDMMDKVQKDVDARAQTKQRKRAAEAAVANAVRNVKEQGIASMKKLSEDMVEVRMADRLRQDEGTKIAASQRRAAADDRFRKSLMDMHNEVTSAEGAKQTQDRVLDEVSMDEQLETDADMKASTTQRQADANRALEHAVRKMKDESIASNHKIHDDMQDVDMADKMRKDLDAKMKASNHQAAASAAFVRAVGKMNEESRKSRQKINADMQDVDMTDKLRQDLDARMKASNDRAHASASFAEAIVNMAKQGTSSMNKVSDDIHASDLMEAKIKASDDRAHASASFATAIISMAKQGTSSMNKVSADIHASDLMEAKIQQAGMLHQAGAAQKMSMAETGRPIIKNAKEHDAAVVKQQHTKLPEPTGAQAAAYVKQSDGALQSQFQLLKKTASLISASQSLPASARQLITRQYQNLKKSLASVETETTKADAVEALQRAKGEAKKDAEHARETRRSRRIAGDEFSDAVKKMKRAALSLQRSATLRSQVQKLADMKHQIKKIQSPGADATKQRIAAKNVMMSLQDQYAQLAKRLHQQRKKFIKAVRKKDEAKYAKLQAQLKHDTDLD